MISNNKDLRITKGCAIKTAGGSTKVCPYCEGKIIKGMMHVAIEALHKSEHYELSPSKLYRSDNIYVHIDCWNKLSKEVKDKINALKKPIHDNKLLVGAQQI